MKTFASVISVLLFASAVVAAPTRATTADQVEPPNQWAKFEKRDVATSDVVSAPQNWGGSEQKREEALKSDAVVAPHNWGGFEQKREEASKSDVVVAPHNWGGFEQKREESGTIKTDAELTPIRWKEFDEEPTSKPVADLKTVNLKGDIDPHTWGGFSQRRGEEYDHAKPVDEADTVNQKGDIDAHKWGGFSERRGEGLGAEADQQFDHHWKGYNPANY